MGELNILSLSEPRCCHWSHCLEITGVNADNVKYESNNHTLRKAKIEAEQHFHTKRFYIQRHINRPTLVKSVCVALIQIINYNNKLYSHTYIQASYLYVHITIMHIVI